MKKLAILFIALYPILTFGQNIKGLVVTEKDKSPVAFASIGLLHLPDSTIESGVITLTDGVYAFDNVKPGDYYIKVSFLGYQSNGTNISITNQTGEQVADTIFLSEETQNLSEVTITGDRLQGKEMVDRTVYTIPAQVAKTSANGYDILKKIPQVQVDFQNNITMNGSSNFIIQVDGKQRDKEFLAKILPSDIETIEIISNPSGKYEGNIDGVLNVILKKEARFGLSGSVSAFVKPLNKPTAILSGSLDYGMGKITFYLTAFTFRQELSINANNVDTFKTIKGDSLNILKGLGNLKVTSTSVNTGFDYYINDKNNISFNINYKPTSQKTDMDNGTDLHGFTDAYMYVQSKDKTTSEEGSASLFYKRTFKKAIQEFSVENTFYLFESNNSKNYGTEIRASQFDSNLSNILMLEDNIDKRNYFSGKINYVHPIGMSVKLEGGYQFYYQKMKFDLYSNQDSTNNIFDYAEVRHSLYGGITLNLKKLGFQSNIRIENSNNTINGSDVPGYYCILPSVNLQYKFSAAQNAKITYNRRINRPGVYDLNPFQRISVNQNISEGNAYLEPEYRDRFQSTYSINFGKNYCSPYVYYEKITDKIGTRNTEIIGTEGQTFLHSRPENLLTGNEMGGGLNAMLWVLNLNARYYQGHFDEFQGASSSQTIEARNYSSYSINGYFFAQLPKKAKLTEFIFFNFNGVSINAQSKTYSTPIYGFGMQKEAGNHNIGFVYLLPFSKNIEFRKTITQTDNHYSDQRIGFDVSWYIQVMYTYKFSKGKNVKKLNRKAEIESDSKSEGIGK